MNEKEALFYADKIKNTSLNKSKEMFAYACDKCNSWHLTSHSQKDRNEIKSLRKAVAKKNSIINKLKLELDQYKSI